MTARRLITALLLSLLGSAIITFWLSKTLWKPQAQAQTRHYVAPTQNLQAGEMLQKANLKVVDWPTNAPINGAFVKLEDVVDRTLLYPATAGEPILDRQLSAVGTGAGLSARIPDGMRAISLKTDQVIGVAGFLLPGTQVDVLVTYHTQNQQNPITSTILQDAQVIAAGHEMQPDPNGKPASVDVVTLLVTPVDAERVTLASAQGTIHFVLRNGSDHQRAVDPPAILSELGTIQQVKGPIRGRSTQVVRITAPANPPSYVVQTIAGTKQTVESFQ